MICKNHNYRKVFLPNKKNKNKLSSMEKVIRLSCVIYVDFEFVLGKKDICKNNLKTPYTIEVNKHKLHRFSVFFFFFVWFFCFCFFLSSMVMLNLKEKNLFIEV